MKIGIDIGGSHVGIGLVDNNGSIILKRERFIVDKTNIQNKIEDFIVDEINQIRKEYDIERVGIAVPGTVSKNIVVKSVNLGIENFDLGTRLENKLNLKIKIKNDAKCAALAELRYGELSDYKDSVFLCIGTGIGMAVIHNGELLESKNVPGYEFSHTIIHKNGHLCNCGKRGCFETYASLKRFKQSISKEFNINSMDGGVIREFIRNNSENSTLRYMLNKYVEDLSIGISNIINIFEPEAICIGGSFAEYKDILYDPLKNALLQENLLFNRRCDIIMKLAKFKNDAGIIGATLI